MKKIVSNYTQYYRALELSESLKNDIKKVYEMDKDAIICGSTALYLYGVLSREPRDLDIITKSPEVFESLKDNKGNKYYPKNGEKKFPHRIIKHASAFKYNTLASFKFDNNIEVERGFLVEIVNDPKVKSWKDFLEMLVYKVAQEVPGFYIPEKNVKDLQYEFYQIAKGIEKEVSENNAFSFEFKMTAINENEITVYSPSGDAVPYVKFDMDGFEIKLEQLETILEYKRFYGRDKDEADIEDITKNK